MFELPRVYPDYLGLEFAIDKVVTLIEINLRNLEVFFGAGGVLNVEVPLRSIKFPKSKLPLGLNVYLGWVIYTTETDFFGREPKRGQWISEKFLDGLSMNLDVTFNEYYNIMGGITLVWVDDLKKWVSSIEGGVSFPPLKSDSLVAGYPQQFEVSVNTVYSKNIISIGKWMEDIKKRYEHRSQIAKYDFYILMKDLLYPLTPQLFEPAKFSEWSEWE